MAGDGDREFLKSARIEWNETETTMSDYSACLLRERDSALTMARSLGHQVELHRQALADMRWKRNFWRYAVFCGLTGMLVQWIWRAL